MTLEFLFARQLNDLFVMTASSCGGNGNPAVFGTAGMAQHSGFLGMCPGIAARRGNKRKSAWLQSSTSEQENLLKPPLNPLLTAPFPLVCLSPQLFFILIASLTFLFSQSKYSFQCTKNYLKLS